MGKPVKLSDELTDHLTSLKQETSESYDACLRRQLGLPTRKGKPQHLEHFWVIPEADPPICRKTQADAKGEAILLSVKRGMKASDKQRPAAVIKVREVPS